MGFSDKIILFDGFNEPLDPITNNIPTLKSQADIKLDSDQEYKFSRVFIQVCYPATPLGGAFRVEFNGRTLGSKSWGPFETGCNIIDTPVTQDMKKGKNELKLHLDGRLQAQELLIYGDMFYELVGNEPPSSVEVGDPSKEDKTKDLIITAGVIIGGVAITAIILNSLLNKGERILRLAS